MAKEFPETNTDYYSVHQAVLYHQNDFQLHEKLQKLFRLLATTEGKGESVEAWAFSQYCADVLDKYLADNGDMDESKKVADMPRDEFADFTQRVLEEYYVWKEENFISTPEQVWKLSSVGEDGVLRFPDTQFPRDLYEELKKQLESLGGKWKGGKIRGFVFSKGHDAQQVLETLRSGVDGAELKKKYQFFETPPDVVEFIVGLIPDCRGKRVLEPSAGQGAIVRGIHAVCPSAAINVIEAWDMNRDILAQYTKGDIKILPDTDFLHHNGLYDIIVANPPFANNQDIKHVMHMWECLAPGGTCISVMSNHFTFANDKESVAFREFLSANGEIVWENGSGAFKESGTMVNTNIVMLRRP